MCLARPAVLSPTQKSLKDQVIVITGASSGIGLTTAEIAAARGAAVVVAARSESDLTDVVARIRSKGGRATAVAADVADERQMTQIGMAAMREFGRIDTWVNNAGLGMYGRLVDQPIEHCRQALAVASLIVPQNGQTLC